MILKEYRVVTEDWTGYAESVEDAIDLARNDTGGRVYAEETGLTHDTGDEYENFLNTMIHKEKLNERAS